MKLDTSAKISIAILAISLITFFNTCGSSTSVSKVNKRIDSLYQIVNRLPTQNDVKRITEQTSYKFLIYETDLDHKKTSLSDIENKLDKEQK